MRSSQERVNPREVWISREDDTAEVKVVASNRVMVTFRRKVGPVQKMPLDEFRRSYVFSRRER